MKSNRSTTSKGSPSPYSKDFKFPIPPDKRVQITTQLCVKELSRRDLEDKFYATYDENYIIKRENKYYREKIKQLATKLIRLSKNSTKTISTINLFQSTDDVRFNFKKLTDQNAQLKEKLEQLVIKYNIDTNLLLEIEKITDNINSGNDRISNSTPELRTEIGQIPSPPRDTLNGGERNKRLGVNSRQSSTDSKYASSHSSKSKGSNGNESEKSYSRNTNNQLLIDKTILEEQIKCMESECNSLKVERDNAAEDNRRLLSEIDTMKEQIVIIEKNAKSVENMKIMDLKKLVRDSRSEIKMLTSSRDALASQNNNLMQRERERVVDLQSRLNRDVENIFELKQKAQYSESSRKQVEQLQKSIRDLENERELLLSEKESLQTLLASPPTECSNCTRNVNLKTYTIDYDDIEKKFENEKSHTEALLNSQHELLEKVKNLQNENDHLTIELDGKRHEAKVLMEMKNELEEKITTITKFALNMDVIKQHQKLQTPDGIKFDQGVDLNTESSWSNKSRC